MSLYVARMMTAALREPGRTHGGLALLPAAAQRSTIADCHEGMTLLSILFL